MRRYVKWPSSLLLAFLIVAIWNGTAIPLMGTMTASASISTKICRGRNGGKSEASLYAVYSSTAFTPED